MCRVLTSAGCQPAARAQALKTENEQLWRMLEDHLSGSSSPAGDGSSGACARPNLYVEHLEAEREQLAAQLAAAQQEHADAAARLASQQAAIAKLQAVVQRLSAAGGKGGSPGIGAGLPLLGPAADDWPCPALSMPASEQQHSGMNDGVPAGGGEGWQTEKRLLKAICKLALAVTMDHMGGGWAGPWCSPWRSASCVFHLRAQICCF